MRLAYVDTSCLVAIAFGEPGSAEIAAELGGFDRLIASNLLEAELRAALAREKVPAGCDDLTAGLTWVHPDRPLGPECARILSHGYVRGADLWHLACALYLSPRPSDLHFATLDTRQGEVACAVGFPALGRPPG